MNYHKAEPTTGTGRSIYLWPRAKDPARQQVYDKLADLGWRFDSTTMLWFTPEGEPEAFGRLETGPRDLVEWARIQPPNSEPMQRPVALLHLTFTKDTP